MRFISSLLLGILLVTGLVACGRSAGPLVGAWELIGEGPDKEQPNDVPKLARSVKVMSETRFAFGQRTADGMVAAGGGTYTYKNGMYVEKVEYHWIPALVGLSIIFEDRVEGDLWYHQASFDVGGRRFDIDELWRRIDK